MVRKEERSTGQKDCGALFVSGKGKLVEFDLYL